MPIIDAAMSRKGMVTLLLTTIIAFGAVAQEPEVAADAPVTLSQRIDSFFGSVVEDYMVPVLFREIGAGWFGEGSPGIPVIILTLVLGGIFFTFRYSFTNVLLFKHALDVVRGKYDNPEETGEITHFQALTSALAATVGLGNIAGVAVAITAGGPGAVFWMWVTAFFGMSMKFSSCTLAQVYRRIQPDGHVLGGPMVYLKEGITDVFGGFGEGGKAVGKVVGSVFGVSFAILTIGASFGGGNMFQVNQVYDIGAKILGQQDMPWFRWFVGIGMAILVGLVVIGGIRRIGEVTSKLVPAMCAGYFFICLIIVLANFTKVPGLFADILVQAFNPEAAFIGGFIGVLIMGMRRAAFSNEAGLGSAAIAHAAAKTEEPVREGTVAMLGPFIDTIVVCTMTALAILITGAHEPFMQDANPEGIVVTTNAFISLHPAMQYFLGLAVMVFAYSTLIAWGYYGERATEFLTGPIGVWPYRIVYVLVAVISPFLSLGNVIGFADMMLLSMAFPNIVGMVIISGKVRRLRDDYLRRLRAGEMKTFK
jgi:AGCS family alanine or glycine:cation symporter